MDLTIYDIIIGPRITEKAYKLNQKLKKLVLEVHPKANKSLIVEALKKLFNVEVDKVGISSFGGKRKRLGRHFFKNKVRKKAVITLKEGYSVDLMNLSNVQEAQSPTESTR